MARTWLSQIRKGLIELCLLELLEHGESYGYALLQSMHTEAALQFNESAVYLALGRLVDGGLLTSSTRKGESTRKRRYFSMTEQGREALEQMRQDWAQTVAALERLRGGAP